MKLLSAYRIREIRAIPSDWQKHWRSNNHDFWETVRDTFAFFLNRHINTWYAKRIYQLSIRHTMREQEKEKRDAMARALERLATEGIQVHMPPSIYQNEQEQEQEQETK